MARRVVIIGSLLALLALPASASASQLIDRNATAVRLQVDRKGQALVAYRARGRTLHVLAWGAVNAIPPAPDRSQVAFRLDYSGGWGTYRRDVWKTFKDACRPYDGPQLGWFMTACKAPDGSYWALQTWRRGLPNYGAPPANPLQGAWELRLSHWTGELPVLAVRLDWAYRLYDHLFGSLTYRGRPVFGFGSTTPGAPLDRYGRNIYVDTYDSAYGGGWRRENSFLSHNPTGAFCYGFYPHGEHPMGKGERYRATVIGPGVTPDLLWQGSAPGPYDRVLDLAANAELQALGDGICRPN